MKQEKVQQILIYTDFTPLGNKCIKWGIFFAKKFEKNILLLHVINDNTYHLFRKKNIENDVKGKLDEIAENIKKHHGIKCNTYYEEGCNCTIINSTAESFDTFFNIIGVHGKSDPQFLSGHAATKIIRKSRIPFFVLQRNSRLPEKVSPLLLPVNTKKEMKETIGWVTYLAKSLPSEIDVFTPNSDDNRIKSNLAFSYNFFRKFDLRYNKVITEAKYIGFSKRALEYSANNNSLFMISLSSKSLSIIDFIFGAPETNLMSNKKGIPIFIITPDKDLYVPCI